MCLWGKVKRFHCKRYLNRMPECTNELGIQVELCHSVNIYHYLVSIKIWFVFANNWLWLNDGNTQVFFFVLPFSWNKKQTFDRNEKKSVSKFSYKYMIKPYMYSPSKFSYKLLNSMPLWSNTYINCFCISPCISYDSIKQQLT